MEYFMHGPPRKGEEEHFHRHPGEGSLKETVERVMYAVFDDRFFLHDAFKSLDGDSTGLLTEDELGHWVHCLSTCSPVQQQTTEPAERCKSCMDKGFTPYRCKCVPRALPKTENDPDVGRAAATPLRILVTALYGVTATLRTALDGLPPPRCGCFTPLRSF